MIGMLESITCANGEMPSGLFKIGNRVPLRLPNLDAAHLSAARTRLRNPRANFPVKIAGNVFRGWIGLAKWFKVIEELMIKPAGQFLHQSLYILEIAQQSNFVQRFTRDGEPNLIVVAVEVFAFAQISPKRMSGSETGLNIKRKH